jgi:hypothetical protein
MIESGVSPSGSSIGESRALIRRKPLQGICGFDSRPEDNPKTLKTGLFDSPFTLDNLYN